MTNLKNYLFFHKEDDSTQSYDIAIFKTDVTHENLSSKNIQLIELYDKEEVPELFSGDSMIVLGYPQYIINGFEQYNQSEPQRISGILIDSIPKENVIAENLKSTLKEEYMIYTSKVITLPTSGISGGLVLLKRNSELYPIGIASTGGDATIKAAGINPTVISFIGFSHFKRLFEILEQCNWYHISNFVFYSNKIPLKITI